MTSYETTPPVRLETSGGVLSTVDMVVQRRDGPRRLRDNDDDDDDMIAMVVSGAGAREDRGGVKCPVAGATFCSNINSNIRQVARILHLPASATLLSSLLIFLSHTSVRPSA